MHGQIVNHAALARDAAVARTTVQRYFDTLVDTLIAHRLPAWRPRLNVRERARPKFYFFNPGVVRAIRDSVDEPLSDADVGPLLEGYVLHELRAAIAYWNLGGEFSYWRTPQGKEVDFVWDKGSRAVAVEVKTSHTWRRQYAKTVNELIDSGKVSRGFVVYRGAERYRVGAVEALPVRDFLDRLHVDVF